MPSSPLRATVTAVRRTCARRSLEEHRPGPEGALLDARGGSKALIHLWPLERVQQAVLERSLLRVVAWHAAQHGMARRAPQGTGMAGHSTARPEGTAGGPPVWSVGLHTPTNTIGIIINNYQKFITTY